MNPDQADTRSRLYPWFVVGVLLLVNALSYLDRQVMSILVGPIQADLALTDTRMGVVLGPAFMALFVVAGMPMGWLTDHAHRGRLLAAAVLIWSGGTVLTGLADDYAALLVGRAVTGLGEAAVVPAAFSLVSDYFPPERRGRATAWVTIGIPIGASSALVGGGFLLQATALLRHQSWPLTGPLAPWQMVLTAFGLCGVVVAALALCVGEPRRRASPTDAGAAASDTSSPLFLAFLRRERAPMTVILLPYILLTYVQVAVIIWVPTLLTRRYGLSAADGAKLFGVVTFLIPVAAAIFGGRIADWLLRTREAGPFLLVTWLSPLYLPGVLLFALAGSLAPAVAGLCLTMVVGGVCSTTVYAAIQNVTPPRFRGRTLALFGLSAQLAGIGLGPLTVGWTSDHLFHDRAMLNWAMVVAVAPACVVISICGLAGRAAFAALRRTTQPPEATPGVAH